MSQEQELMQVEQVEAFLAQEGQVASFQAQIDDHDLLLQQCDSYLTGA